MQCFFLCRPDLLEGGVVMTDRLTTERRAYLQIGTINSGTFVNKIYKSTQNQMLLPDIGIFMIRNCKTISSSTQTEPTSRPAKLPAKII